MDLPPPRTPGPWSGIGTVALYFALQLAAGLVIGLASGFAIALVVAARASLRGLKAEPAIIQKTVQHLVLQPEVRVGIILATLVIAATAMLWFIHWRWRPLWAIAQPPGFGFSRPRHGAYVLLAVVLGLAAAYFGGLLANALAGPHAPRQDIDIWARSVTLGLRVPLAIATVCIVPVVEEAVFRGVLLSGLLRRLQVAWAVVCSALVFGLVHLPDFKFAWYPVPTLVLFGLLLAWLRLRSGSLWPAITAHATLNAVGAATWFLTLRPHP